MKDTLDRIESKLDTMQDKVANIDKTLAINTTSLQEHMSRTKLNEARIEIIETHVHQVQGAVKFSSVLAAISGFLLTCAKLLGLF